MALERESIGRDEVLAARASPRKSPRDSIGGMQVPLALLVSGAPGSGKSTVGSRMAARMGAALLDLDTATASLTAVIASLQGTDDLDDPAFAEMTRNARYEAIAALAEENLANGVNVVLVAPFTAERRDPAVWTALKDRLERVGATAVLVWLRIPADEVRRRVGEREAARDRGKLDGGWLAGLELEPPVVPHLEVDALQSPDRIAESVLGHVVTEVVG